MTATTDDRDVVDLLTTDHQDVLALIDEISAESDPERRRDLADTVIAELVRHSVAEEMFVYPAMRKHFDDGEQVVQHDNEEHQELEEALKRLEGVAGDDPAFTPALKQVEELLRHHANDEETEQFPRLRETISHEDLVQLGNKVELAKQAAPTRPHPSSPHSELFHKTVGPGVGMIDKLRDALSGRATG